MPATESTWRNIKLLHVVFGVSSIAMLVTTIWMFVADHNRPWKQYQLQTRELESYTTALRIAEQNSSVYQETTAQLRGDVAVAQANDWYSNPQQFGELLGLVDQAKAIGIELKTKSGLLTRTADVKPVLQKQIDETTKVRQELITKLAGADAKATEIALRKAIKSGENSEIKTAFDTYVATRGKFITTYEDLIKQVKFAEDNLSLRVKAQTAAQGKAAADRDQAIGRGPNPGDKGEFAAEIARLNKIYDEETYKLQGGTAVDPKASGKPEGFVQQLQQTKTLRESMQAQLASLLAPETTAKKALADHENKVGQLQAVKYERSNNFWKTLLAAPILDAFGSDIRPEQIWLPDLTMTNGSFGKVARFDRCVTCHTGITKTAPGSATEPAFPEEKSFTVTLDLAELPKELREQIAAERGKDTSFAAMNDQLRRSYGFALAETGLFAINDATISIVYPESLAAKAGLGMGDVITRIGTSPKTSETKTRAAAEVALLSNPDWKREAGAIPMTITVRRGVPQPYCSHPRMDLFVGSTSPHPAEKFGCTICHQGQGSGTSFQNSSHTPNSEIQEQKWTKEQGWSLNHHWIEPMLPTRFDQASCLKCHHNVVELEASTRFPDPPAAKLVHGYETIREYGCFGCHEINGYDGPSKRIGPDMRVEPQYFAAAEQLLADPGFKNLGATAVALAEKVSAHPEDSAARRELLAIVNRDQEQTDKGKNPDGKPVLKSDSYRLAAVLKDVETPGDLRKVGPSLRHVASKVGYQFLYDWLRNPKDFRPSTKMPRFFGLHDHLTGDILDRTQRYEAIEIQGITEYLLNVSQPYDQIKPATGVAAAAIERGKKVFEVRGCLACHEHDDFPAGHAHQGPNLSRIAEKLSLDNPEQGTKWLYSWVREPNRYHNRTVMPNVYLEPYPVMKMENGKEVRDANNKPIVEQTVDPAADVVAYLMKKGEHEWKPSAAIPAQKNLPKVSSAAELATFRKEGYPQKKLTDLEALAYEDLAGKYTKARATEVLEQGVTVEVARGDETALVGVTPENRAAKLLEFVGRRSISKYGCFGCHDIPGYEDSKAIGAALADWGRKDPAKLAFENIGAYVHDVMQHGHGGGHAAKGHNSNEHGPHSAEAHAAAANKSTNEPLALTVAAQDAYETEDQIKMGLEYLSAKMLGHEREGFLWNKLNRPRSYDYLKTEKPHKDRLRMPKFTFSLDEKQQSETIEAVMTFVLGLVADPPPAQYVFTPNTAQKQIIAGRKLLEKYNCGGCHTLGLERLDLVFKSGTEELNIPSADHKFFPFQELTATPEQAAASTKTDKSGRTRETLWGMFTRDKDSGKIAVLDAEDDSVIEDPASSPPGTKFKYQFNNYEPVVVDGKAIPVTPRSFIFPDTLMAKTAAGEKTVRYWPAKGGDLTRLLFPVVLRDAVTKPGNPSEAFGWLPPPLFNEGRKVQTKWLHDFLLDPKPIRPAAVLRMPKFNMSSAEAQAFAEYFATMDNAPHPYQVNPEQGEAYLAASAKEHPERMDVAMKIITSSAGCVKCHIVGDYSPGGDPKALGPQLSEVHARLRPDYVKSWIANPHSHLPYTAMLRVIEATKPSAAGAFDPNALKLEKKPGESDDDFAKRSDAAKLREAELQLQAVTDYFTNYDRILKGQYQFSKQVPPPAPPAGSPAAPGTGPASE